MLEFFTLPIIMIILFYSLFGLLFSILVGKKMHTMEFPIKSFRIFIFVILCGPGVWIASLICHIVILVKYIYRDWDNFFERIAAFMDKRKPRY